MGDATVEGAARVALPLRCRRVRLSGHGAVRASGEGDEAEFQRLAYTHWRARALSMWRLTQIKGKWLRFAVFGFNGPLIYFVGALLA